MQILTPNLASLLTQILLHFNTFEYDHFECYIQLTEDIVIK